MKYKAGDKVLIELDEEEAELANGGQFNILQHIPHKEVMTEKYKAGDKVTVEIIFTDSLADIYNKYGLPDNAKVISHIPAPEPKKFEYWANVYENDCVISMNQDVSAANYLGKYKYTIHSIIYPDDSSKNIYETVVL